MNSSAELEFGIARELSAIRTTSRAPFEQISRVVTRRLAEGVASRGAAERLTGLTVEQLLCVSGLGAHGAIRGWTSTWARAAAHLLVVDSAFAERIEASPDRVVPLGLERIAELAAEDIGLQGSARRVVLERLVSWSWSSRKPVGTSERSLSTESFSEGLLDRLSDFYGELSFLTVQQVDALQASFRRPRLWIEGAAGTGKTLVAMEMLYRRLQAGEVCVVSYRSVQFEQIFEAALGGLPGGLILLPHLDLVRLLQLTRDYGRDSAAFSEFAEEVLPGVDIDSDGPVIDFMVVDDCGTYYVEFPRLVEFCDEMSSATVMLAAPEQVMAELRVGYVDDEHELNCEEEATTREQGLECPENYAAITLDENLRSSRSVLRAANEFAPTELPGAVVSEGTLIIGGCTWETIGESIEDFVLAVAPGGEMSLQVLVDPFLTVPPPLRDAVSAGAGEIAHDYSAIAEAVAASAWGSFLNSTLEVPVSAVLAELIAKTPASGLRFFYTDGETAHLATTLGPRPAAKPSVIDTAVLRRGLGRVAAEGILDPEALSDPLQRESAVMVLPTPLFIGLEADAVVYVRDELDSFERLAQVSRAERERIRAIRRQHHFMAMSRARFALLDLRVSPPAE